MPDSSLRAQQHAECASCGCNSQSKQQQAVAGAAVQGALVQCAALAVKLPACRLC